MVVLRTQTVTKKSVGKTNGSIGVITDWVNNTSAYTTNELAGVIEKFNKIIVTEFFG